MNDNIENHTRFYMHVKKCMYLSINMIYTLPNTGITLNVTPNVLIVYLSMFSCIILWLNARS